MSINAEISPFPPLGRREVEDAVRHAMSACRPAILLKMLSEAPGYAHDIARSLKFSLQTVEQEMTNLAQIGLIAETTDAYGSWFRLRDSHVLEIVDAVELKSCYKELLLGTA